MIRRLAASVFLCCACLMLAPMRAQKFTLQQVMSGAFNSELQASPKGSRLLWVANQEGRRNIWVADVKDGGASARRVTAYAADDGEDLGDITWTPDGESIVYVRGGDFEYPGRPSPNPALLPGGVQREIWLVSAAGGTPRRLAEG